MVHETIRAHSLKAGGRLYKSGKRENQIVLCAATALELEVSSKFLVCRTDVNARVHTCVSV